MSPAPLFETLTVLVDTALIRRLDDAEPAYMIKHALVQDTAHATLLKNENKRLHLLVAIALEQVNAARLDDYAAELARHFEEAEHAAKTFEYSLRAGDLDARVFANTEALAHYDRAIALAPRGIATPQQIIHLYTRRGRILEVIGKYHKALASYLELHELAEQRGDRSLELAYLMLRAPLHSSPLPTFDATLAKALLLDALGTARELGDETAEARVLWNLTLLSVHTMHPADGVMYGELSLGLAEKLNLSEQQAYTLHELFIPYRSTGQLAKAHDVLVRARALFREQGNKPMLADNLGMTAQMTFYEGDLAAAIEFAAEGMALSRSTDNPFGVYYNQTFLILGHFERGEPDAALVMVDELLEQHKKNTPTPNGAWILSMVAWYFGTMGAEAASRHIAQLSRDKRWLPIPPMLRVGVAGMRARANLLCGDLDKALADITAGLDESTPEDLINPTAWLLSFAQAEIALAQGDLNHALELLKQQVERARDAGFRLGQAENLLLQGRAYLALKDFENGSAVLAQARDLTREMGARRLDWQVLAARSDLEIHCGNPAQAAQYRAQARSVLEYVVEHTPSIYRQGFLNLPEVARITSPS